MARADIRSMTNETLDHAIAHATGERRGDLMNERTRRINREEARNLAIAGLWDEYGIDADDCRRVNGSLVLKAGSYTVETQGGHNLRSMAVLSRKAMSRGGSAAVVRWFGGLDAQRGSKRFFSSPEVALLTALREGFIPAPVL